MDIPLSVPELVPWLMSNLMLIAMSGVITLIVVQILKRRTYRLSISHILIGLVLFIGLIVLLPILLPTIF